MIPDNKRKILFDCDTGTDDAIAIIGALYESSVEIVGFTTVSGNASIDHTSRNTLNLLRYLDFHIPVAKGACAPLKKRNEVSSVTIHGESGLGSVIIPDTDDKFDSRNAVEMIYDEAKKYGGTLEIVATGPYTNLAISLLLYPELKTLIKHIYLMGGAAKGGNISSVAEFNVWVDPEAAKIVYDSGIPITMIGLDVTQNTVLTVDDAKKMRTIGSKASIFIADMLDFMNERYKKGGEGLVMHDALAFASAVCEKVIIIKPCHVEIECDDKLTFGHTCVELISEGSQKANADVAFEVELEVFRDWLFSNINTSKKI